MGTQIERTLMDIVLIILLLLLFFGGGSGLYFSHGDPLAIILVVLLVLAVLGYGGWRWRGPRD